MPEEIVINNFTAGWCSSDDEINGRKNGLLQMDNVELDENGSITLAGGTEVKNTGFSGNAHTMFSPIIAGARHDYAALSDGTVFRDSTSIITGGSTTRAAFGKAFNFTLICSATKRYKDTGSGTPVNLGILPATAAPTVAVATILNAPSSSIGTLTTNYVTVVGSVAVVANYLQMTATGGTCIVQTYAAALAVSDCSKQTGVGAGNVGVMMDRDTVLLMGYTTNPVGQSIKFDILLVAGDASGNPVTDYYTYTVDDLGTLEYDSYTGVFNIRIKRSDFERIGAGNQTWASVYGYRVTYTAPAGSILNLLGSYPSGGPFYFYGGSKSLDGDDVQYVQVNVNNTGSYIAKSVIGVPSSAFNVHNTQCLITPQDPTTVDAQCNEAWIYRRGGLLDKWYRVKVFNATTGYATATYDMVGDQEALTLNLTLNLNLVSVQTLSDTIFDIVGPISGRWFYFTTNFIYPSEINNPDLVDASIAVRSTGSNSELFMWARKIDTATILVGTTHDFYTMTGTFSTLTDQTIDAYYLPLSCKYPPISYDVDTYNKQAYYMSASGWRAIDVSGANPLIVSPNNDLLYKNEARHGYTGVNLKIVPGAVRFPVVVARNKLWCFITGTARCEVYDFTRQYWRVVKLGLSDATAACSTEDGQILAFYSVDKKTRELDSQTTKLIDGATKQTLSLKWVVADGGTPRQRKDSINFKARCYTGAADHMFVNIENETHVSTSLTQIASNTAVVEKFIDLSTYANLAVVKTYQLSIVAQVSDFTLEELVISYDLRPIQTSYLHILPNNYGTCARKRLYTVPFTIDTLGVATTLTPRVDGVDQTALSVTSTRKETFEYQFNLAGTDVLKGVDYEYFIHSATGLFEFFGFTTPKNVEVLPEPQRAFVIPVTNYGTPNRKRIPVRRFVLDPMSTVVTFTPIIDGTYGTSQTYTGTGKRTCFYYYTADFIGVDFGGIFSAPGDFELYEILQPDIIHVFPTSRHWDQVGPDEFFRYGRIRKFAVRIFPYTSVKGTTSNLPYTIYFNDNSEQTGTIVVNNMVDQTYEVVVPRGVGGDVFRFVLGPTAYDFHRYYIKAQIMVTGRDTDNEWITLAGSQ